MTTPGWLSASPLASRARRPWHLAAGVVTAIALGVGHAGGAGAAGVDTVPGQADQEVVLRGLDLSDATFTQVTAGGGTHSLGLAQDGTVWAWGDNAYGQLGNGTTVLSRVPVRVDMTGALAGKQVAQVVAGRFHSAALTTDGQVYTWGQNTHGQLGNDSTTSSSTTPVAVTKTGALAGKTVLSLGAGGEHMIATASDGTSTWTYAWGRNTYGQLGDGTTTTSRVPVAVSADGAIPADETIAAVDGGDAYTLALAASGALYAWGINRRGQLGDDTTTDAHVPVKVAALGDSDPAAQIATGWEHSAAVTTTGAVYTWGLNFNGQLGLGTTSNAWSPRRVTALADRTVTSIAAGSNHTVATTSDGQGLAWGSNVSGQLGSGSFGGYQTRPVAAGSPDAFLGQGLASITTGGTHTVALTTAGQVMTWGGNVSGQLGNGTTGNSAIPVQLLTHVVRFGTQQAASARVDLGAGTITTRRPGGTSGWVDVVADLAGSPGPGGASSSAGEVVVSGLDLVEATFAQVAGGDLHSMGLAKDGTLWAWGDNSFGQLGNGTTTASKVPVRVTTTGALAGKRIARVEAGRHYSAALTTDGRVYTWGENGHGQLGNGTTERSSVPVAVDTTGALAGRTVTSIAAGSDHVVATASDGTSSWVYAWGLNQFGQLGDGHHTSSAVPVTVSTVGELPATEDIRAVAAGERHTVALTATGAVYAWGVNSVGQLGTGAPHGSAFPVKTAVPDLAAAPVTRIAAGAQHALALTSTGTVHAWGGNDHGQLGTGSTDQYARTPAPVTGLAGQIVVSVSAGAHHTVATTTDGRGFAWGANGYGQLAHDDADDARDPLELGRAGALEGETLTAIAAGGGHTVALAVTGQVIGWGRNGSGQTGNGAADPDDAAHPLPGQLLTHTILFGSDRAPGTRIAVDLPAGTLTAHRPEGLGGRMPVTVTLAGS